MKIRIEISSGNVSYVLVKELDMDVNPQAIIEDIEGIISLHESPDISGCSFCKYYETPFEMEPCVDCLFERDGSLPKFERKSY